LAVYNLLMISKAYLLIVSGTVSNMIGTSVHLQLSINCA